MTTRRSFLGSILALGAHGADAYRQFGQEADAGNQFRGAPIALTKTGAPQPLAQRKRWGRGRVRSPMGV